MKFTVTMKTPDAVWEALQGLDLCDIDEAAAEDFADQWVSYGEVVSIEFDTEAGTATVLKRN